jgi:hypothetical protein
VCYTLYRQPLSFEPAHDCHNPCALFPHVRHAPGLDRMFNVAMKHSFAPNTTSM